ncbi:MAG: cell wall-binding repeat-containing protein, partial [Firmicutes bacterium]|nr:cell wall-binding repeat-containing protein [Bacillota bacterium]
RAFIYTFTAVPPATYTVTYKVVNGTWSDGTVKDKTEVVIRGDYPARIPTGMKAAGGYEGGAWDTDPATVEILDDRAFIYTFTAVPPATYTVTYKVVNGTWSDGTTKDKRETVTEGSKPAKVPTGMKPADGYEDGAWNADPATAKITKARTFTYTFEASPGLTEMTFDGTAVYTGKPITPTVTVYGGKSPDKAKILTKDKDYTIKYVNNVNAGTATITVTGKGDYDGELEKTFQISPASIGKAKISGIKASYTRTGYAIKPAPTVKLAIGGQTRTLKANADYTVTYANNIKTGTATLTIKGVKNFQGTKTVTFKIGAADIAKATVSGIKASYPESMEPVEPKPTVKLSLGGKTVTLKAGTDYSVSYARNLEPGTATLTIKGKGNYTGTITKTFKITAVKDPAARIERLWGQNRYQTARAIADAYKKQLGVTRFSTIILADGYNFPDALAGAYFASVKDAPIVTINGAAPAAKDNQETIAYIRKNVKKGGLVYIIGGPGSVDKSFETTLSKEYKVIRLWGQNRYLSNLAILEGAKVKAGMDFIVCTGQEFGDALSASATGKPILLVGGTKLTDEQKNYLKGVKAKSFTIIGSVKEVPAGIENELKGFATVTRIGGSTVYDRSIAVARKYFSGVQRHINLASGRNHADGLCGGPLAVKRGGPLILTDDVAGIYSKAASYAKTGEAFKVTVYGGTGSLQDATVKAVLSMK